MSNPFAALDSDNDDEAPTKVVAKKEAPKGAPKAEAPKPAAASKPKGKLSLLAKVTLWWFRLPIA